MLESEAKMAASEMTAIMDKVLIEVANSQLRGHMKNELLRLCELAKERTRKAKEEYDRAVRLAHPSGQHWPVEIEKCPQCKTAVDSLMLKCAEYCRAHNMAPNQENLRLVVEKILEMEYNA